MTAPCNNKNASLNWLKTRKANHFTARFSFAISPFPVTIAYSFSLKCCHHPCVALAAVFFCIGSIFTAVLRRICTVFILRFVLGLILRLIGCILSFCVICILVIIFRHIIFSHFMIPPVSFLQV